VISRAIEVYEHVQEKEDKTSPKLQVKT